MNNSKLPICIRMMLTGLLTGLICLYANAQKLPNVQKISLRAPAKTKVDGKSVEWGNTFQAYNNATEIFYTMANDDENLYLAIQTNDPNIISRLMGGGVTLSIQKAGVKTDKNAISITYPVTEQTPYFNLRRKKMVEDTTAKTADSLMLHNNMLIGQYCKWIRVSGITGVDSLISVYNTDGIKAAGAFNNKKVYTCELAINLKLLNISTAYATKFAYHIRMNGARSVGTISVMSSTPGNEAVMQAFVARANETGARLSAPTDFWGEYVLVGK